MLNRGYIQSIDGPAPAQTGRCRAWTDNTPSAGREVHQSVAKGANVAREKNRGECLELKAGRDPGARDGVDEWHPDAWQSKACMCTR